MAFVVVGWILFRAPDFATGIHAGGRRRNVRRSHAACARRSTFDIPANSYDAVTQRLRPDAVLAVVTAQVAIAVVLEVGKGQPQTFIYFQF